VFILKEESGFTLAERQEVVTGNAKLHVSGRIEYKDALGKSHLSSFLYTHAGSLNPCRMTVRIGMIE
jgi:hypothetical protein